MNFKILVGDKGFVDFDSPIKVNKKEKDKFFSLMKKLFDPSIIEEKMVEKFRDWRIGERKLYPRKWRPKEYAALLRSHSTEEAERKLGRSGMAIIVQDGKWRPRFLKWCEKKGKDPFSENMVNIIEDFIKEKIKKKKKRREERKKRRKKEKEIKKLKEELKYWNSEKAKQKADFLKRMGKIVGVDDYLHKKKKEIYQNIEKLKNNEQH